MLWACVQAFLRSTRVSARPFKSIITMYYIHLNLIMIKKFFNTAVNHDHKASLLKRKKLKNQTSCVAKLHGIVVKMLLALPIISRLKIHFLLQKYFKSWLLSWNILKTDEEFMSSHLKKIRNNLNFLVNFT